MWTWKESNCCWVSLKFRWKRNCSENGIIQLRDEIYWYRNHKNRTIRNGNGSFYENECFFSIHLLLYCLTIMSIENIRFLAYKFLFICIWSNVCVLRFLTQFLFVFVYFENIFPLKLRITNFISVKELLEVGVFRPTHSLMEEEHSCVTRFSSLFSVRHFSQLLSHFSFISWVY